MDPGLNITREFANEAFIFFSVYTCVIFHIQQRTSFASISNFLREEVYPELRSPLEQGCVLKKVVPRKSHLKVQKCIALVLANIFARNLISLKEQVFESILAKTEHCDYIPL